MKSVRLFLVAVFALIHTSAFSVPIDTAKSEIHWLGKKVTGEHSGTIRVKSGEVTLQGTELKGGQFEIDMTSIQNDDVKDPTYKAKLIDHLKSDDFFSVKKFPVALFKITSVKRLKGKHSHEISGDLTIKGITHPIKFPAQIESKNGKTTARATVKIDRTNWNIRYGSGKFFLNLGDKLIYDDFELNLNLTSQI